jgi:hypothetical protein
MWPSNMATAGGAAEHRMLVIVRMHSFIRTQLLPVDSWLFVEC